MVIGLLFFDKIKSRITFQNLSNRKEMKIRMETKQIILETRTDEDVIEITLAMIDLQVPVLHEPRYTDLGYESCFLCGKRPANAYNS